MKSIPNAPLSRTRHNTIGRFTFVTTCACRYRQDISPSQTTQKKKTTMMQLDKLDMSDPKTVTAVVAIGALGLAMCVQLVFLFATLFKSAGSASSVHSSSVSPSLSAQLF